MREGGSYGLTTDQREDKRKISEEIEKGGRRKDLSTRERVKIREHRCFKGSDSKSSTSLEISGRRERQLGLEGELIKRSFINTQRSEKIDKRGVAGRGSSN